MDRNSRPRGREVLRSHDWIRGAVMIRPLDYDFAIEVVAERLARNLGRWIEGHAVAGFEGTA